MKEYKELVRDFNQMRKLIRDFYVFGHKSREIYTEKSSRIYDYNLKRLRSWMKDTITYRNVGHKRVWFLSVDTRLSRHNPLYSAWKGRTITDKEIVIHFYLMDVLWNPEIEMTSEQIHEAIDAYQEIPVDFTTRALEGILKKYVEEEGILQKEKRGRPLYYRRCPEEEPVNRDVLDLASEISPCGVIGSFLLDKTSYQQEPNDGRPELFAFKHHYITSAIDCGIQYELLKAMEARREVTLEVEDPRPYIPHLCQVVPLEIRNSVQNGRQYVMAYVAALKRIEPFRLDYILEVKDGKTAEDFLDLRHSLKKMNAHIWGVNTGSDRGNSLEHVTFTIEYDRQEKPYILRRLQRGKRCGTVEELDDCHSRFSADVYDATELIPWIRSFVGRITELHFSDERLEERFLQTLENLYQMYGIEENDHAI